MGTMGTYDKDDDNSLDDNKASDLEHSRNNMDHDMDYDSPSDKEEDCTPMKISKKRQRKDEHVVPAKKIRKERAKSHHWSTKDTNFVKTHFRDCILDRIDRLPTVGELRTFLKENPSFLEEDGYTIEKKESLLKTKVMNERKTLREKNIGHWSEFHKQRARFQRELHVRWKRSSRETTLSQ